MNTMAEHMTAEQVRAELLKLAEIVGLMDPHENEDAKRADHVDGKLRYLAARLSGMGAVHWTHVDDAEPAHDTRAHSFGTEYIVHPSQRGERTAFYGRRLGGRAKWYRHGARVTGITHYAPLPEPPHV
jgi:hypothetical protein